MIIKMAIDISGVSYFMPIIGFLFVFTIVYALLAKLKLLGENKFINLLVAFIVAIIFSAMSSAQEYVETVTPWFVVLMIALFFVLILVGFRGMDYEKFFTPGVMWVFIAVLIVIFLIAAIKVFPTVFGDLWDQVTDFVTNEARIAGAIILLIVAALAAWVITRK